MICPKCKEDTVVKIEGNAYCFNYKCNAKLVFIDNEPEKSAKEMFEELGFFLRTDWEGNLIKNDNHIHYDKHSGNGNVREHITFYLTNNPESGFIPSYITSKARNSACGWKMKSVDVSPNLHKAITQQMKELGWDDASKQ